MMKYKSPLLESALDAPIIRAGGFFTVPTFQAIADMEENNQLTLAKHVLEHAPKKLAPPSKVLPSIPEVKAAIGKCSASEASTSGSSAHPTNKQTIKTGNKRAPRTRNKTSK